MQRSISIGRTARHGHPLFKAFVDKNETRIAKDHYGDLVYLASSSVNLSMTQERHPDVRFLDTKEHGGA